jgi:hypothetical protein
LALAGISNNRLGVFAVLLEHKGRELALLPEEMLTKGLLLSLA